jgi:hypothetical protein
MRNDKSHIFHRLDRIEDITGKMIHEIPELADKLKSWQDGDLNDIYFYETLNKYWDSLNNVELNMVVLYDK